MKQILWFSEDVVIVNSAEWDAWELGSAEGKVTPWIRLS